MQQRLVPSTAIDALGYDYATKILEVTFRRGDGSLDSYYYHAVDIKTVSKLDNAESIGVAFNKYVRDNDSLRVFKKGRDVDSFGDVAETVGVA